MGLHSFCRSFVAASKLLFRSPSKRKIRNGRLSRSGFFVLDPFKEILLEFKSHIGLVPPQSGCHKKPYFRSNVTKKGSKEVQKALDKLERDLRNAVAHYWMTRVAQSEKQKLRGVTDAGLRSAVTGGAQMDGFIDLFTALITGVGIPEKFVFRKTSLELPGYFRPTKEWDIIVVKNGHLIAAIEAKSQVGPSFGNNFNNRTEEAIGSAIDLWTAFREGAFNAGSQPFLGYFFMLEDCPGSNTPVKVKEPHFKVFPEFIGASYMKRYELLCRKLILERHYTSACFLTSETDTDLRGEFREPAKDLAFEKFARTIVSHVGAFIQ